MTASYLSWLVVVAVIVTISTRSVTENDVDGMIGVNSNGRLLFRDGGEEITLHDLIDAVNSTRDLQDTISNLRTVVNLQSATVSDLLLNLRTLQTVVTSQTANISALQVENARLQSRFEDLDSKATSLATAAASSAINITAIQTAASLLQARTHAVETKLDGLQSSLLDLQADMASLNCNTTSGQMCMANLSAVEARLGSVERNVSTLGGSVNGLQGFTEQLQIGVCDDNLFSEYQQIATSGASAWESFSINGTFYLAVANRQSSATAFTIQSVIYRLDMISGRFVVFQQIDTTGASDWEFFTINGSHYLAVANLQSSSSNFNVQSVVYRFNESTKMFVSHQSISTAGAVRMESFVIKNQTYLFIANFYSGTTHNLKSLLYQFNTTSRMFVLAQQIDTFGAYGSAFFSVGSSTHYLAVVNTRDSSKNSHLTQSAIYRFNQSSGQFDLYQQIDTAGATNCKHFEIEGCHYLAVANQLNDLSRNIMSAIYRLDPETWRFVPYQQIATHSAFYSEYFEANNEKYIALANFFDGTSYTIDSVIYRYSSVSGFFEASQLLRTSGATMLRHFTLNSVPYLAVANFYDGTSYNLNSVIYKLNDFCLPAQTAYVSMNQQAVDFAAIQADVSFLQTRSVMLESSLAGNITALTMRTDALELDLSSRNTSCLQVCMTNLTTVEARQGSVEQNVSALGISIGNLQGFTEQLQVGVCKDNLFSEYQQIATSGAWAWESFNINGTDYLAVANRRNSASTFAIDSVIYRLNATSKKFVVFQQISTISASDWEYFGVDGSHYLAVANYQSSSSNFTTHSVVYRFNASSGVFESHQQIRTMGAREFDSFVINDQLYLFIINYLGTTQNSKSHLYRFNTTTCLLVLVQQIDTFGARGSAFFTVGGSAHYLAVANHYNSSTSSYLTKSAIYRFNLTSGQYDLHQQIDTAGALDWEHFEIAGSHYLAVANYRNDVFYSIMSVIYRLDSTTCLFMPFQQIATQGASDFEYFAIGSDKYLAVANNIDDDASYTIDSVIYRHIAVSGFFEAYQPLQTSGAIMLHYFTLNCVAYLAAANSFGGTSYNVNSVIYKLNDVCLPAEFISSSASVVSQYAVHLAAIQADVSLLQTRSAMLESSLSGNVTALTVRADALELNLSGLLIRNFTAIQLSTANLSAVEARLGTVEQNVSALGSSVNNLQGLTEQLQVGVCKDNLFAEYQHIATKGARAWEAFRINGIIYLAVVGATSVIYQYNDTSGQFVVFQQILTGANDCEYFTLNGSHYLAVADSQGDLYVFNASANMFEWYQAISPLLGGATNIEYFIVGNQTFLFIAIRYNGSTHNIRSQLHRFNSTTRLFDLSQQIDTFGAYGSAFFSVGSSAHYLAVANNYNSSSSSSLTKSAIYRFNQSNGQFELHQQIDTAGAIDWEHFEIASKHYLAVTNFKSDASFNVMSVIYRLDSATSMLVPYQEIATHGAVNFEFFAIGSERFLAVANNYDGTFYTLDSVIYRYSALSGFFEAYQRLRTSGAIMLHYFNVNNTPYLAAANNYNGSSSDVSSIIYKLNDFCLPAQSAHVATNYGVDLAAIQADVSLLQTRSAMLESSLSGYITALTVRTDALELNMSDLINRDFTATQLSTANLSAVEARLCTVEQNVSALGSSVNNLQGLTEQLQVGVCEDNLFSEYQQIATSGAYAWESFSINGTDYLAVANSQSNATSTAIKSAIYRYNATSGQFVVFQQIDTVGATDWEYFSVSGSHYLAVANFQSSGSTTNFTTQSVVYRFNTSSSTFEPHQMIGTTGAFKLESFVIDGQTYLFISCLTNGASYNIKSSLYRFNSTSCQLVLAQRIDTFGARGSAFFTVDNSTHYLAVTNQRNSSTPSNMARSAIFRFNQSSGQLDMHQQINTAGAADCKHFEITGSHYLAVANQLNDTSSNIVSVIYRLDPATSLFVPFQEIATQSAIDFEFFVVGGHRFLAVANFNDGTSYSIIFLYNPISGYFEDYQPLLTSGAAVLHYFTINGTPYLAVANSYSGTSNNINSAIYKMNDFCFPAD